MNLWRFLSRTNHVNNKIQPDSRGTKPAQPPVLLESLEPRLLLSGDFLAGPVTDQSLLLQDAEQSVVVESLSDQDALGEEATEGIPVSGSNPESPLYQVPELPGLHLVDPTSIDRMAGQVFYLNFDGAEDVIYDGPVTIGPLDVPTFQAPGELAGQEQAIIDQVLSNLQDVFADAGVVFTMEQPESRTEYSTIYIGGDDSLFSQYGSFLGLAEQVDVGNRNQSDEGLVFSDNVARKAEFDSNAVANRLAATIAHECGHLLGFAHDKNAIGVSYLFQRDAMSALGTPSHDGRSAYSPTLAMLTVGQSLGDEIGKIADGLDEILLEIKTLLEDSADLAAPLPLIGDKLTAAANFIEAFRTQVHDALSGKTVAEDVTEALTSCLTELNLLGPEGVKLDDSQANAYEWTVDLAQSLALASSDLGFDIGLAGLDLTVTSNIAFSFAWAFKFSFGVTLADGFFFDTADETLDVGFRVTTPDLNARGTLGFLQLDVVDKATDPSRLEGSFTADISGGGADNRVTLDELDSLAVNPDLRADTHASVNLHFTASFDGKAVFPSLDSDFTLVWDAITDPSAASGLAITFDNVRMNLGSFLSDMAYHIFEQVQNVLAPLNSALNSDLIGDKSLLEMLIDPIPGISYLLGDTNFLDLMEFMGAEGVKAAEQPIRAMIRVLDIYDFLADVVQGSNGSSVWIEFGEFTIVGNQLREQIDEIDPSPEDESWIDQLAAWADSEPDVEAEPFLEGLKAKPEDGGFLFPFLDGDEPGSFPLFSLMLGRMEDFNGEAIDLFLYDLPLLDFFGGYTHYFPFPPFPAVGLTLGGGLGLTIDLAFGYDTTGIEEYQTTKDPLALFDGFYVVDKYDGEQDIPEVQIKAGVELGASAAKVATVGGGLNGTVDFDLYDRDGDRKISVAEIGQNFDEGKEYFSGKYGSGLGFIMAPLGLFDFGGRIGVNLFVQIGPWKWYIPDPPITLIDFSWEMPRSDPDYSPEDKPDDDVIPAEMVVDIGTLLQDAEANLRDELEELESDTWHFVSVSLSNMMTYVRHEGGVVGSESLSKGVTYDYIYVYEVREKTTDEFGTSYGPWEEFISGPVAGNYWVEPEHAKNHIEVIGTDNVDTVYFVQGVISESSIDVKGAGDTVDLSDGTEGPAMIIGGDGNDTITGGNKNDIIQGGPGPDTIHGGAGDDMIAGDEGADYLYGDAGVDEISGGSEDDWIYGGGDSDLLYGEGGSDWIYGQEGNDILSGGIGNDHLFGGDHSDLIMGDAGTDIIEGGFGDDLIYGGADSDTAAGGAGDDAVLGGAGNDILFGDQGVVTPSYVEGRVSATDGVDHVYGGGSYDLICGGGFGDFIYGDEDESGDSDSTAAKDIIVGDGGRIDRTTGTVSNLSPTGGPDTIQGNAGDDKIYGGAEDDEIHGSDGGDYLYGGSGNDEVYGEAGDDTIDGGSGHDVILGDSGVVVDSIKDKLNPGTATPEVSLSALPRGNDIVMGGLDNDWIYGQGSDDILIGDTGAVDDASATADATAGSDHIYGQEGEDKILGGGGDDYLYGFEENANDSGQQRDIIIGDGGTIEYGSKFTFNSVSQIVADSDTGGNDTIQGNEGDDIILAGAGADADVQGNAGNDIILGDNGTINLTGGVLSDISTEGQPIGGADKLWGDSGADGNDIIIGGPDGDEIYGEEDADILIGDNGAVNDTGDQFIQSFSETSDGSDEAYGQEGEDKILGGGGDDHLYGDRNPDGSLAGSDPDILIGDGGIIAYGGSKFEFEDVAEILSTSETGGNDTIEGNGGTDIAFGGAADDTIYGQADNDILLGDNGSIDMAASSINSVVDTGDGADTICGQESEDKILGGGGGDYLYGDENGAGEDTSLRRDIIIGDAGAIVYSGDGFSFEDVTGVSAAGDTGGSDTVEGNDGDDLILGGGAGDARLSGNGGDDVLFGDGGRVDLNAGLATVITNCGESSGGADEIHGDSGGDMVLGGASGDAISGDSGGDILLGDNGRIALSGGQISTIDTTGESSGGADTIDGDEAEDIIIGGPNGSSDVIQGDDGDDVILGDNGYLDFGLDGDLAGLDLVRSATDGIGGGDILSGQAGSDCILGGTGGDEINGDDGDDILIGDNGEVNLTAPKPQEEPLVFRGGGVEQVRTIDETESTGGGDLVKGGEGRDIIFGGVNNGGIDELCGDFDLPGPYDDEDVIVGDNGMAEFMAAGKLSEVRSTDPHLGGPDSILGGNARDVVIAGAGGDVVDAGGDDDEPDTVLGDNGRITFAGSEEFDPGEEYSIISFNFGAGCFDTTVNGVAGASAARAGNWNNLVGGGHTVYGDEAGELVYLDDGRIAPGVLVEWGHSLDSTEPEGANRDLHGQISPGDDQDLRLFEGYLVTRDTLGVDITGLMEHFLSFDVYVYLDADNGDSDRKASVRRIGDGTTDFYLNDPDGNTFAGDYVQVASVNPSAPEKGNYVVFGGLTGDGARIRIDDYGSSSFWSSNKAAITGIQIVGRHHPIDRVETLDPEFGGDDVLLSGGGADLVLGGSGNDEIDTSGDATRGRQDADIVVADNGRATFMLQQLREIHTTEPDYGGDDVVASGNGEDLVLGGSGNDEVDAGVHGAFDNGEVRVVSLNFNSGVPEGMVTGVAGAVQVGNWNNLVGPGWCKFGDRSDEIIYFDDGSTADGLTVERAGGMVTFFLAGDATDSHDQIGNPGTQNERLFEGYLCSNSGGGIGLDIEGLDVLGSPYDVYVYVDADDVHGGSDSSVYRVSDGTSDLYLSDPEGHTFEGEFIEATAVEPQAAEPGNYVVFRDLVSDAVEIRVVSERNGFGKDRPSPVINAIQIVGGPDKDNVVMGGDAEKDAVLGDNGVAHRFGGGLFDLKTSCSQVAGDDVIYVGDDTDLVMGGSGADEIHGEDGHDLVLGDNGRLILFEREVIDLDFSEFNDDDYLSEGQPYCITGIQLLEDAVGGSDVLIGGAGDDLLYGQFGNDVFVFTGRGLGRDRLVEAGCMCSGGRPNDLHDLLDLSGFGGEVELDVSKSESQAVNAGVVNGDVNLTLTLFSCSAFEDVVSSALDDTIKGNMRDNMLDAGAGDDTVQGAHGDDILWGREGNDNLSGDWGDDVLLGGSGKDTLDGGEGCSILIGGLGADDLLGGCDEDILIGSYTIFDENANVLSAIRDIWTSGDSLASRVALIRGLYLIPGATVFDDGVTDVLRGGWWKRNWFFADRDHAHGDDELEGYWTRSMVDLL